MSAGEIIALVAVVVFAVLVALVAVPLLKLGKTLDEASASLRTLTGSTVPVLTDTQTTVQQVNAQLVRADAITANVQSTTGNVSALTSVFAATLGGPVIKLAAFSYGVRRAAGNRQRADVERRVKAELKSERRGRRDA